MSQALRPNQPGAGTAAVAGLAGQGFLMLAKQQGWQLPDSVVLIIGVLSIVALIISGLVYLRWTWHWIRAHLADGNALGSKITAGVRRNLIPILIGVAIVASAALLAVSITVAIKYRAGDFDSKGSDVVINIPTPAPALVAAPFSGKLVANEPPDIPTELAKRVAKYWQLRDSITRTQAVRQELQQSGLMFLGSLKPFTGGYRSKAIAYSGPQWNEQLTRVRAINDLVYKNRPLDLTGIPQLAIPTNVAPDESVFKEEDGEARYKYRSFHFLYQNVMKQVDQLISDMERDASSIRKTTVSEKLDD